MANQILWPLARVANQMLQDSDFCRRAPVVEDDFIAFYIEAEPGQIMIRAYYNTGDIVTMQLVANIHKSIHFMSRGETMIGLRESRRTIVNQYGRDVKRLWQQVVARSKRWELEATNG